jgi:hypothetical protein
MSAVWQRNESTNRANLVTMRRIRFAHAIVLPIVLLASCGGTTAPSAKPISLHSASTTESPTPPSTTSTSEAGNGDSVASLPPSSFPQPVSDALMFLQSKTDLPLAGPTDLFGTSPLSALATVTKGGGYGVDLYLCPTPLPLNDPGIRSSCEDGADTVGSFGLSPEPSSSAAIDALPGEASLGGQMAPMKACPVQARVSLIGGQAVATCGRLSEDPSGPAIASWREGDWTIVYTLDTGQQSWQQVVGPLVQRLNQVLLPPFPGWIGVAEAGDGEHTIAAWADGPNVMTVFSYHGAVGAADLASSTRLLER